MFNFIIFILSNQSIKPQTKATLHSIQSIKPQTKATLRSIQVHRQIYYRRKVLQLATAYSLTYSTKIKNASGFTPVYPIRSFVILL
jgi:hypothetical protein